MRNPYWQSEGQTHPISIDDIQRLCFETVNIVAAAGELIVETGEHSFIADLHHRYAETELCKKLLQLALLVRTWDDIASASPRADDYREHARRTSGENEIGSLTVAGEEACFNLREACNKIIHAEEIRAIYDDAVNHSDGDAEDRHWFCVGEVELKGSQQKKAWEASLFVYEFIETVLARIQFEF
jgi:hypothetical protein